MRRADYVYRNADDTRRVRVLKRENGRWVFDVFHHDGSIETSSDHAEDYRRKIDARAAAVDAVGPLVPIQVREVRAGWDSPERSSEDEAVKFSGLTEPQIDILWREAGRQHMSLLVDMCERWMDCDGTGRTTIEGTIIACIRGSKLATLVGL